MPEPDRAGFYGRYAAEDAKIDADLDELRKIAVNFSTGRKRHVEEFGVAPPKPTPLDPAQVLDAVRRMDSRQRRELAAMLGLPPEPSTLIVLPAGEGFIERRYDRPDKGWGTQRG